MPTGNSGTEGCLAVIGCGNMGGAMVRGFCRNPGRLPVQISVYDADPAKSAALAAELAVEQAGSLEAAARKAGCIIIAVKPAVVPAVAAALSEALPSSSKQLIISVAAGVGLAGILEAAKRPLRVVRAMPNIACMAGAGMTALFGSNREDVLQARDVLAVLGKVEELSSEAEFDAVTGLSGCGPGFLSLVLEALADGAVKMGMSRERALRMSAQTALGTAAVVLETGIHPAQLKDMVCSPGGLTIAGIHVLEQAGVRAALISAVETGTRKAR